jgi:aminopeptidase S
VYYPIGKVQTHCGPFLDDFEAPRGWAADPLGDDTATSGRWQRTNPAATTYQAGTVTSGSLALVTGGAAGSSSNANDVDGGSTSVRSAPIRLPDPVGRLTFRFYLAHSSNSSSADRLETYIEQEDGTRTRVHFEVGAANVDRPAWSTASIPLTPWAGQTVRVVFVATDAGAGSVVEAGIDDVRVTRP